MFAKRKTSNVTSTSTAGRVYILELTTLNGEVVHKVGMTRSDRSTDRMMEILRSWFQVYRYVPHTSCRLDHETGVPLLLEQHLHEILGDWKWVPDKKVDGGQEMFTDIDVKEVIHYIKYFDYSLLLDTDKKLHDADHKYILSRIALDAAYDKEIPF